MRVRQTTKIYVMFCTIWCYMYNLKNVKNTHGGVLLLATFLKKHSSMGAFYVF